MNAEGNLYNQILLKMETLLHFDMNIIFFAGETVRLDGNSALCAHFRVMILKYLLHSGSCKKE